VPPSCALLGKFAIGEGVVLLCQHSMNVKCQRVFVLACACYTSHNAHIIIIIIVQKFIMRTCSQALSMNRRRGQSLGGLTVCINC